MRFSISFFASRPARRELGLYNGMLECSRFADANGFDAVWLPERHFSAHGSMFPNPAVLAAAVATTTERIRIRAGSVVLPLHDPIRVAEEWSVVDNLSGGRVDLAFAAGWARTDFVLAPDAYATRRDDIVPAVREVVSLWRGATVARRLPDGETAVSILPRPVQDDINVWLSSGGGGEQTTTPRIAGELGFNLLTHTVSQTLANLRNRVDTYRQSRAEAGLPSDIGVVTVLQHTYVSPPGRDDRNAVEAALREYIDDSLSLQAASEAAGHRPQRKSGLSDRQRNLMLTRAVRRLSETDSLIGSFDHCAKRVEALAAAGVDEIACLVDFGLPIDEVLPSLGRVAELRRRYSQ